MNSNFVFQPNNDNRLFNNAQFIHMLVSEIRLKLGRNLLKMEKVFIINYLKNTSPLIFKNRKYADILNILCKQIVEHIVKLDCQNTEQIDIHEVLKTSIGVSTEEQSGAIDSQTNDFATNIVNTFASQVDVTTFLGNTTIEALQKVINPELVKTYAYIMLDSRYRLLENDGTTEFKWNFINNESIAQGSVNAIGDIQNITAMRIYPVRIPYNAAADNEYNRVSLFIQEFSAQSFLAQENRRFHFMFNISVSDRWIELNPQNFNDGFFRFRNPIARLETLTISFGAPLDRVVFDTDRMNMSINSVTGFGTTTEITTVSNHNLETGDFVFITGFTTHNSISDSAVINAINSTSGNIITFTGPTTFTIDVNSSNIVTSGPGGSTVSINNGSTSVTGVGTNFLTLFSINDVIIIAGVSYKVASVLTNTSLTITLPYAGVNLAGGAYQRNNSINGLFSNVYFGSKRIFVPIELEYYKA